MLERLPAELHSRATDTIPRLGDEEAVRARIGRNRALATGLLSGMGVLFGATWLVPSPGFGTALLRAGAEAGIVGGLADWFAVTALFRQPLGLPIPHTAILPRSKERVGRALGSFVERGFLTEVALLPRIRALRPGQRVAAWLSEPENVRSLVGPTVAALPQLVSALDRGPLRAFLSQVVGDRLKTLDLAPLVGRALEVVTQTGEGDVLFERAIGFFLRWLEANRAEIDRLVAQRSRWWVPAAIDRRVARAIVESITELLTGLRNPDTATRQRFGRALDELIAGLKRSEHEEEWNRARDRLLGHPELQAWLNAIWTELSSALVADAEAPASRTRAVLETVIGSLGAILAREPAMQARIDTAIERVLGQVVAHRGGIVSYMVDVIRGWDAQTLSDRFELIVGSDLQFIRMNGTLVGFLVGCGLFLVTRLLGG